MPLGRKVGLGLGNIVLDGDRAPPPNGAQTPIFGPCLLWIKTAGCISIPLGKEVGLSPDDIVLDGDSAAPTPKSQTARWVKMPLGTEVGFGEGHSVLDGDPAPPRLKKGAQLLPNFSAHACYGQTAGLIKMPLGTEVGLVQATLCWIFGPCLLWLNGWIDQDITWYGGRPRPRRH